ncbi:MAG: hypothetical protein R2877_02230 [Bdellovibrionota bacterium]
MANVYRKKKDFINATKLLSCGDPDPGKKNNIDAIINTLALTYYDQQKV